MSYNQDYNQGYNQGYNQPQEPYGEARGFDENDGERSILGRANEYFHEKDGDLDKSHIFLAGAGALATGYAGKKIYEHFQNNNEAVENLYGNQPVAPGQKPQFYDANGNPIHNLYHPDGTPIEQDLYYANGQPVDPSIMDKIKDFYTDDDGSVDKSHVFLTGLGALVAGLAAKKAYNHFQSDDQAPQDQYAHYQQQGEKPHYNAHGQPEDPSFVDKVKNFYTDEDGSVDKSRVFLTGLGALAAGYAGNKIYDHFQNNDEEEGRRNLDEGNY
ncbi:hypothetical protein GGI07_002450 [Coemansia sp. Benny D115]|nr:hypothetical protein GGI07_002450 [Coemansia sp. Benny D115]